MSNKEVVLEVMGLLRRGEINRSTTNGEVMKMVGVKDEGLFTKKEIQHISDILDWYEGTDGCEREEPCYQMYVILTNLYNKEIEKYGNNNQGKR